MTEASKGRWTVFFQRLNDPSSKVVMLSTAAPEGQRGDGVALSTVIAVASVEFPNVPFGELHLFEMKHQRMLYLTKGRYGSS